MTDIYTVVCMQTNRVGIDNRTEIRKANLDRILEIFGYGPLRLSFREYAPLGLVVLPEVFMTICLLAPLMSVKPSGVDLATNSAAMRPSAPVLFSTRTCWPSASETFGAITRARMSLPPPGANPTIHLIGLVG